MPTVSEAQRRAMWAAASGHSNLGIPKSVGEEFVGKDADPGNGKHAAGVVYVTPSGDVLLLRRSPDEGNYGGHWGLPGGGGEEGETPEQTARRESLEEMGAGVPEGSLRPLNRVKTPTGMIFHTFAQAVDKPFAPALDAEHTGYCWASLDMLPKPLHPSVANDLGAHIGAAEDMSPEDWKLLRETFAKWTREEESEGEHAEDALPAEIADLIKARVASGASPRVAMDWAGKLLHALQPSRSRGVAFDRSSVRHVDSDGRLHVKIANISKAAINPYLGREINAVMEGEPGWQPLEDDKLYKLLRDPEELRKGAPTFNNLPLLSTHEAVSADDHKPALVVGSLGTDADYEHPFLTNSLVVWAKHGIDGIESDEQKELSSSYRYKADMTPGEYEGEAYDGVMRDIVGNHVALVSKGRAGPEVVIGDSALETETMSKKTLKLTTAGAFTAGVVAAAILPKLAKDTALDFGAVFGKLDPKKPLKDQRPALLEGLKTVKLAKDASLDDVTGLLDKLEKKEGGVDAAEILEPNAAPIADPEEEAMDAGGLGKVMEYLKTCVGRALTEEDLAKLGEIGASDEEPDLEAGPDGAMDEKDDKDGKEKKDMVDKKAMDAAIAKVKTDTLKLANDIAAARDFVEPWVGKIASSVAFDSAEAVYGKALEMRGLQTKDVHPSAFKHILQAQPKTSEQRRQQPAFDAKPVDGKSFADRFPVAAKVAAG